MAIKLTDITKDPKSVITSPRGLIPLGVLLILISSWFIYPSNPLNEDALPSNSTVEQHEQTQIKPTDYDQVGQITFENASAIFNTINSLLKPKHSQILPIGVSFIPAVIPEGTLLYHGNQDGNIPNGLEWIAIDSEFSYWFIANRGGPNLNGTFPGKPPKNGPPGQGPPPPKDGPPHETQDKGSHGFDPDKGGISPGGGRHHEKQGNSHTSLFTFQVKKPLDRMILLDGSSGAKSQTGEMDTQMILAKAGVNETMNEYQAAEKICKWGEPFGLDGFIRIEIGFEAIICDFKNDKLELVSNITLGWKQESIGFPLEKEYSEEPVQKVLDALDATSGFEFMNQGNAHSKRDKRILVNYKGLVTPLNKTWINPDPYLRRINNLTDDLKNEMIQDLEIYLTNPVDVVSGTDWQFVTDEIVDKFTPILKILNESLASYQRSDDNDSLVGYAKNSVIYTNNFVRRFRDQYIEDEIKQIEAAKQFAVYQYTHPLTPITTESEHLIWSSITKVTSEIVDFIFELNTQSLKILKTAYAKKESVAKYSNVIAAAQQNIIRLLDTLNWVEFYQCDRQCQTDELCFVPSWGPSPFGWSGKDQFGTETPVPGEHRRIKNPLQCVSYKTILEEKAKRDSMII